MNQTIRIEELLSNSVKHFSGLKLDVPIPPKDHFSLEDLQANDIFSLGLLFIELEDTKDFLQRLWPKPAAFPTDLLGLLLSLMQSRI